MKRSLPILATVAFCMIFCAQSFAQLRDPGVYAPTSSGPLRLSELPMPGQKASSWVLQALGDDRLKLHYMWAGGTSYATVSERRPTFRINLSYLPDRALYAIQIVKLEQKGDYREAS